MADRPETLLQNGSLWAADVGAINGRLDLLCCVTDVSYSQEVQQEDITCDRRVGRTDRLEYDPKGSLTISTLNFNETVLERWRNLTPSYNTAGYRTLANGDDPNTVPTLLSQVDGPHAPTYVATVASLAMNNANLIPDSVVAWTRNDDGTFTVAALDNIDSSSDAAIGVITITVAALTPVLYFTYKYDPMPVGTLEMKNPFTSFFTSFQRFRFSSEQGDYVWDYDFWKVKASNNFTAQLISSSGDLVYKTEGTFDIFADTRYHADSPIYAMSKRVAATAFTPYYDCEGSVLSTPTHWSSV